MLAEIKLQYVLLASVLCFSMENTTPFTQFTRNQSLLELTLNCTGEFLSSEAKCLMTALEKDKGIAIFNSDSLTCQTCREDSGNYVSRNGDVAWSECLYIFRKHVLLKHSDDIYNIFLCLICY